jgi:hypothetical protein
MAYEIPGADKISLPTHDDLSAKQYFFVTMNSDGEAIAVTGDGDLPIGILQNAPTAGQTAEIMLRGISKIRTVAAGLVTGVLVGPTATGLGQTFVINANTWNLHWVCGVAASTTIAAGDIGTMMLQDPWPIMIAV